MGKGVVLVELTYPDYDSPTQTLIEGLDVDVENGLADNEIEDRVQKYGVNKLEGIKPRSKLAIFFEQFLDVLVLILLAAMVLSLLIWIVEAIAGESEEPLPYDFIAISLIVIVNALIGFFQEFRAEKAIESLKRLTETFAIVLRDGRKQQINTLDLVPGDIVLIESGDIVPADIRLLRTQNLRINEAALTGESVPARKRMVKEKLEDINTEDSVYSRAVAYLGTPVTDGKATGLVVSTGAQTKLGNITTLLKETKPDNTPLQNNLQDMGKKLAYLVSLIALIVMITGFLVAEDPDIRTVLLLFTFAIALAVAAIPEGLPAVVTVALSIGLKNMAANNAVIRKLPAVETLGSTTVICTDKTGTLTKNEMTVQRLVTVNNEYHLTGAGYSKEGKLIQDDNDAEVTKLTKDLQIMGEIAVLCNNAAVHYEADDINVLGDPTEVALLVLAEKMGYNSEKLDKEMERTAEITFTSARKQMSTIYEKKDGKQYLLYNKGSPEAVLQQATHYMENGGRKKLSQEIRDRIGEQVLGMSAQALRTLGFSYREIDKDDFVYEENMPDDNLDRFEKGTTFLGLVGIIDPPREEALEAVKECKRAGIRTIMITGDHRLTALTIAKQLEITTQESENVITGSDLSGMTETDLETAIKSCNVFARVNPEHKLIIVEELKRQGEVVAMTGDGVNDSPALKAANIGVAMGITGTDTAKEAADMVLVDDNFNTIVKAVEEGRRIYTNIQKFIIYLLSSNAGEVMAIFFGVLLATVIGLTLEDGSLALPLLATQLLWINLLTDSAPAIALGFDETAEDTMDKPPRDSSKPILIPQTWGLIVFSGIIMCIGSLFLIDAYAPGGLFTLADNPSIDLARTMAFTTIVMYQLFHVFNISAFDRSVFKAKIRNKWLFVAVGVSLLLQIIVVYAPGIQSAFHTEALSLYQWIVTFVVGATILLVMEIAKGFFVLWGRKTGKRITAI